MRQKTVANPVSCKGIALHTGEISFLEFRPAEENSGIYFLHNGHRVDASAKNIISTNRGSMLSSISTVEHVLSAVYGCGIENVELFLEGPEPPALDGSAKDFVGLLRRAGIKEQNAESRHMSVKETVRVESGDSFIEISPLGHLAIEVFIDYTHTIAGVVKAKYDELADDFEKDIAPARTFGLLEEVEALKKAGLAKGASLENAIAITKTGYSSPLRFDNELARHKILDIIGDMALAGGRIRGKIVSRKALDTLIILLSPFAPHMSEELWRRLGNSGTIAYEPWPTYDPELIKEKEFELAVQVNGKIKDRIVVSADADDEQIKQKALACEKVAAAMAGKEAKKIIVIKSRLVNIIV
jgi:UDP-3-O-[3-hydroxymyristoyl] N-acetylglucosamine deacetylase